MKLKFLGTRGKVTETSKTHKNHSAILLETHGKVILMDFGVSWKNKFKLFNPDFIWISHIHSDHVLGLKNEKVTIPVFMSKETSDRLSSDKFPFLDRRIVKGKFKIDSISAEVIPVEHSIRAPMSGLIVETDEGRIGYFPDVLDIENKSIFKGLKIYIGDGTSLHKNIVRTIDGKKVGHSSIVDQCVWCQEAGVEKVIFTHWGKVPIKMGNEKLADEVMTIGEKVAPHIPIEIAIDNSEFGAGLVRKLSKRETEVILSNYLGSKKKYIKEIFKWIPLDTKTLFDPCCGSGPVLIEAARRGIQIIGNDLSPIAFLYCKGIFQGKVLTKEDEEKFKSFKSITGWLSKSGLMRPQRRESKRLLDGLIIGAWKNFSGGKRQAALASLSRLVQHYFRGFLAFISEEEPYSKHQILEDLSKSIKEVNQLIIEVGGKGKIFHRDILEEKIPKADVIYFDPPFFPKGIKNQIKYFKHYNIANSFLRQKKYQPEDPTREEITKFLPKLAAKAKILLISSAAPSEINWEQELSDLKKNVKRIRLSKISTGSQPQGAARGHIDKPQRFQENLFCASDIEIKPIPIKLERLLFKLEGYDPEKVNDRQLNDDLRICAMKWALILKNKKTEFKGKEHLLKFAEEIMKEVLKRGKITFHPKYRIKEGKMEVVE